MIKRLSRSKIEKIYDGLKLEWLPESISRAEIEKIHVYGYIYKNKDEYSEYISLQDDNIRIVSTTLVATTLAKFLKNGKFNMSKFSRIWIFEKYKCKNSRNMNYYKPTDIFHKYF